MNASVMLKSTAGAQAAEEDAVAQEFTSSMAELEAFVKARGAAEKKKPLEGDADKKGECGKCQDDGEETITKSVDTGKDKEAVSEAGKVVDGEEVIKQFEDKLVKSIASVQSGVQAAQASTDEALVILAKSVHAMQTVVATMHNQLAAYGNAGRPRKSLLTVVTKSVTGAEGERPAMSANDILTKSVASALTASQVSEVRHYVQANQPVPDHLMREIEKVK